MRGRAAALLGSALLLAPAAAAAHAVLVRASPPARAVLAAPPPRVELWFNERLEPAYVSLEVLAATGARMDAGDATVAAGDPRRLAVTVPAPLGPGEYRVRYRVLSVDGHRVESGFSFTVRPR